MERREVHLPSLILKELVLFEDEKVLKRFNAMCIHFHSASLLLKK